MKLQWDAKDGKVCDKVAHACCHMSMSSSLNLLINVSQYLAFLHHMSNGGLDNQRKDPPNEW
jgi:hypothetical protein